MYIVVTCYYVFLCGYYHEVTLLSGKVPPSMILIFLKVHIDMNIQAKFKCLI